MVISKDLVEKFKPIENPQNKELYRKVGRSYTT